MSKMNVNNDNDEVNDSTLSSSTEVSPSEGEKVVNVDHLLSYVNEMTNGGLSEVKRYYNTEVDLTTNSSKGENNTSANYTVALQVLQQGLDAIRSCEDLPMHIDDVPKVLIAKSKLYSAKALIYMEQELYRKAITECNNAIENADPNNAEAYLLRCRAKERVGNNSRTEGVRMIGGAIEDIEWVLRNEMMNRNGKEVRTMLCCGDIIGGVLGMGIQESDNTSAGAILVNGIKNAIEWGIRMETAESDSSESLKSEEFNLEKDSESKTSENKTEKTDADAPVDPKAEYRKSPKQILSELRNLMRNSLKFVSGSDSESDADSAKSSNISVDDIMKLPNSLHQPILKELLDLNYTLTTSSAESTVTASIPPKEKPTALLLLWLLILKYKKSIKDEEFEDVIEDLASDSIRELRERFEEVVTRNGLRHKRVQSGPGSSSSSSEDSDSNALINASNHYANQSEDLATEIANMIAQEGMGSSSSSSSVDAEKLAGIYQIPIDDAEVILEWIEKATRIHKALEIE